MLDHKSVFHVVGPNSKFRGIQDQKNLNVTRRSPIFARRMPGAEMSFHASFAFPAHWDGRNAGGLGLPSHPRFRSSQRVRRTERPEESRSDANGLSSGRRIAVRESDSLSDNYTIDCLCACSSQDRATYPCTRMRLKRVLFLQECNGDELHCCERQRQGRRLRHLCAGDYQKPSWCVESAAS